MSLVKDKISGEGKRSKEGQVSAEEGGLCTLVGA